MSFIACFNLDMVATAYEPVSELGVFTSNGAENILTDYAKKAGEFLERYSTKDTEYNGEFDGLTPNGTLVPIANSDHYKFSAFSIPSVCYSNMEPYTKDSMKAIYEPYYHSPNDNYGNISSDWLLRSIRLVALSAIFMVYDM